MRLSLARFGRALGRFSHRAQLLRRSNARASTRGMDAAVARSRSSDSDSNSLTRSEFTQERLFALGPGFNSFNQI